MKDISAEMILPREIARGVTPLLENTMVPLKMAPMVLKVLDAVKNLSPLEEDGITMILAIIERAQHDGNSIRFVAHCMDVLEHMQRVAKEDGEAEAVEKASGEY